MAQVWITRTQPGAAKTAKALQSRGYVPVIAPLLRVEPVDSSPPKLPEQATVVLTSKNGLRAFVATTDDRHWPLVTVGDATARLAQELGFRNVRSANGTSADVINLIKSTSGPQDYPIIHISGVKTRGDITGALTAAGVSARRDVYYRTLAITEMPKIDVAKLTHVMLHSPFAAQTLRRLAPDLSHVSAISMSDETDKALGDMPFKARHVAQHPTENAMMSVLD